MRARVVIVLALAALAHATPALAVGHCAAEETTFFSCTLAADGRVVSLCGDADPVRGWLQFRAGPIGRPDVAVPTSRAGSRAQFAGEHLMRDGAPVDSVWFRDGRVSYGLQARNPAPAFHGLWEMRGRVTRELPCAALPDGWAAQGQRRFSELVRALAR